MTDKTQAPHDESPVQRPTGMGSIIVWTLAIAVAFGALVAVLQVDNWGNNGNGLSPRFGIDTAKLTEVDPALIAYVETQSIPLQMDVVHAIATDRDNRLLVAGDSVVQVLSAEGELVKSIPLASEPTCIAVAAEDHPYEGRIFVGTGNRIELFDDNGDSVGSLTDGLDEKTALTSIAVFENSVFAADAGNRVVLHWDAEGKQIGVIGTPAPDRGIIGFVVPSAHFDIVASDDGLLRVANPGARRVETYTANGDLLGHWGTASASIEGFFGCCNPAAIAMLADGRFVTAEKGIPRVKVYDAEGVLDSVVATPQMFSKGMTNTIEIRDDHSLQVLDVATDREDRILILDPNRREIRIFERTTASDANHE
ncbi:NHL repeat-containing protein [Novipirellula artificiosorum]|uniref:NHL repeat protein n=1 Tax=Novipirellula artificiosorum TaxID=2528016 RepID=A0A5C6DYA2_9BACT|nr:hypothetical protein [Novipirellula artificiosorum]TWU42423.1 hypothetical protein Poly41_07200 [Novipirellula artificiosorum]